MTFNTQLFEDLSKDMKKESRSEVYSKLDSVLPTLLELLVVRKLYKKQVVDLLIKSGFSPDEMNVQKLSAYWASRSTKESIHDFEKARSSLKTTNKVETPITSISDDKPHTEKHLQDIPTIGTDDTCSVETKVEAVTLPKVEKPVVTRVEKPVVTRVKKPVVTRVEKPVVMDARHRRAQIPSSVLRSTISKTVVNKITGEVLPGDLLVPWSMFINVAKNKHNLRSIEISLLLQDTGILFKDEDKKFSLLIECKHIFPNLEVGQVIDFPTLEVYGETLIHEIRKS